MSVNNFSIERVHLTFNVLGECGIEGITDVKKVSSDRWMSGRMGCEGPYVGYPPTLASQEQLALRELISCLPHALSPPYSIKWLSFSLHVRWSGACRPHA